MKNRVIVFTTNNARILVGANPDHFSDWPNAVINPDPEALKELVRVQPRPHFWKTVDGMIVPLTEEERVEREADLKKNGADNLVRRIPALGEQVLNPEPASRTAVILAKVAGLTGLGLAAAYLLSRLL